MDKRTENMEKLTLQIGGMSCGHCVAQVDKALRGLPGAEVEQVAIGSATVVFDPSRTSADAVAAAITDAGYAATPRAAGSRA